MAKAGDIVRYIDPTNVERVAVLLTDPDAAGTATLFPLDRVASISGIAISPNAVSNVIAHYRAGGPPYYAL